jgi:8-oxo-dGTP pyrophosphatase MutT (NUDIX family)
VALSPYLAHLRAKVGHELLLTPSVTVLARDEEGRVLLVRSRDTGLWQTIGGMIELDESPQAAAHREAYEETGVTVELRAILTVLGGPQFRVTYPNGDQIAYVTTVFDARISGGEPRPDGDETTAVGWFAPGQLAREETDEITLAILAAVIPPGGIEPPLRA